MAKRMTSRPDKNKVDSRRDRARAAFEAVVDEIHDEHRVLEGEDLVKAVYDIFEVVRPQSSFKEAK